ncbi:MAG: ribosome biogenesis GTPase Der [Deltaproteobacteria bacterium]|nr:ribosome biogenesis GTPase Der [Candidatus Zymogenaceae bacterium]
MTNGKKIVAIVGRPNVGKSTFFNRIVGTRRAIVEDEPGVTRDRIYADARWGDTEFTLIDTGGFMPDADTEILRGVHEMAELAVEESDIILFLMDARDGVRPDDSEMFNYLRKTKKPVFALVNKVDGPKQESEIYEFYQLGMDTLYAISAQHNIGINDVMDDVVFSLTGMMEEHPSETPDAPHIAIVGRPNVGKSSLLNRLTGYGRSLVDDTPGTTRDSIDTLVYTENRPYVLIDTAGIRRKSRISMAVEKFSVFASLRSIDRADAALLLLDAEEGPTDQDIRIARLIKDKGVASVILVNKWDLVEKDERTAGTFALRIQDEMKNISYSPIIFISAKSGKNVHRIYPAVDTVIENRNRRIPTGELNSFFDIISTEHSPGLYHGKPVKIFYITQTSIAPPTFVLFSNNPKGIKPAYHRFIINRLRDAYDFSGTPIRLYHRKRERERVKKA